MGRTLHYELQENKSVGLTEADWDKINQITKYFVDNYKWTCEQPQFSNIGYFPRWPEWFKDSALPKLPGGNTNDNVQKYWDVVESEVKKLEAKNLTRLQTVKELLARKIIALHGDDPNVIDLQKAHGFTKVAGNEWNAVLVTAWLTAVSKVLPQHVFTLHDEGDFLTTRLVIRNGQARGEHSSVWKDVGSFCRNINPADFAQHPEFKTLVLSVDKDGKGTSNGGGSQIMAGFGGEYFKSPKGTSDTPINILIQSLVNHAEAFCFNGGYSK